MSVVALDGFSLSRRGKGISRALVNIITRLLATDGGIRYVVLTRAEGRSLLGQVPSAAVTVVPEMMGSVWEQLGLPTFARRLRANLVYVHRECAPLWGPPVVAHVPENPELRWARSQAAGFREWARSRYEQIVMRRSLRRADVVVASTDAVARWLSMLLTPRRVGVVHLGVEERFFRAQPRRKAGGYLFHLGSADPRDNTALVVGAYRQLRARRAAVPPLIIAGALGGLEKDLRLQLVDGSIRTVGWVTDGELAELYAGALVCVQPSQYEGFGLQPLEAMAAGSPLIVFDTPAVREVVGEAAVCIASQEESALAEAIDRLLDDSVLRSKLRHEGRVRAERFTWTATAKALHNLFQDVLQARASSAHRG